MDNSDTALVSDTPGLAASDTHGGNKKPDGRKGAVMARPGNQNARKHGAYARSNMSELHKKKHAVVAARDKYREEAEKEAAEVLKAYGLTDDPLAGIVGRGLARLEALVHRLEEFHDKRGYFKNRGELKPSVDKQIQLIGSILGEARRLLDALAEVGERPIQQQRPPSVQAWIDGLAGGSGEQPVVVAEGDSD